MEMPEVTRCFGTFPPKYGCYLIALFGLGSGGVGIAGIVLYGVVENAILVHFVAKTDDGVKKAVLMSIGLSSLLLLVGNAILLLGISFNNRGFVATFKWIIFVMCSLLILGAIGLPMSCFFLPNTCVLKKISTPVFVLAALVFTVFVQLWLYFMVVAYNLEQEM